MLVVCWLDDLSKKIGQIIPIYDPLMAMLFFNRSLVVLAAQGMECIHGCNGKN